MTNEELETRLESLVNHERRITREILQLILVAEDRKIHLARGFGSIVRWLIGRYSYSETAALRRVQAARLLRAVPTADGKIQTGELNLTTLAKAQSVIRAEERRTGERLPASQKVEVAEAIVNKSLSSTERKLAEIFPEATKSLEQSRVQDRGRDEVRISITVKRETYEMMLKVQAALGHALPGADLAAVTEHVYKEYWKRKNPQREVRPVERSATAAVAQGKTAVSAIVRRQVFQRDNGRCQYIDPVTKRRCLSEHRIEIDHIQPRALGGTNEADNLRCLCRAHNAYRAEQTFGPRPRAHVH